MHTLFSRRTIIAAMIFGGCALLHTACNKTHEEPQKAVEEKEEVALSRHRQQHEERAAMYLKDARRSMEDGDYDTARELIELLRDTCYLALDARERALLLLDSVELYAAMSDSSLPDHETRVKFYQKKLEFDRQAPRKHQIGDNTSDKAE